MPSSAELTGTASIRKLLQRLGLEERETELYLALLPMKIAKVSAIAKTAKQPRTLTYIVLQNLEEKGLVSRIKRANVLHFVAEPPERLVSYAHNRSQEFSQVESLLEGALPWLHSLTSPLAGEPRVTLLKGADGMKQVYRDALAHEVHGCGNAKTMWEHYGKSAPEHAYGPKFKDFTMKGKDLFVDNKEATWFIRDNPPSKDYQIRLLPKGTSFIADSLIYGDTVALFAYDEELSIVRIENQHIADFFRAWHKVMWGASSYHIVP